MCFLTRPPYSYILAYMYLQRKRLTTQVRCLFKSFVLLVLVSSSACWLKLLNISLATRVNIDYIKYFCSFDFDARKALVVDTLKMDFFIDRLNELQAFDTTFWSTNQINILMDTMKESTSLANNSIWGILDFKCFASVFMGIPMEHKRKWIFHKLQAPTLAILHKYHSPVSVPDQNFHFYWTHGKFQHKTDNNQFHNLTTRSFAERTTFILSRFRQGNRFWCKSKFMIRKVHTSHTRNCRWCHDFPLSDQWAVSKHQNVPCRKVLANHMNKYLSFFDNVLFLLEDHYGLVCRYANQ
jgi:hypothetical protein